MGQGWEMKAGASPLVAAAIHDGHAVRPGLLAKLALSDRERRREEDPWTARWLTLSDSWVRVDRSRFECDLNRAPEACLYASPDDAWGLDLWRTPPNADDHAESRRWHEAFYAQVGALLAEHAARFGAFVVYDLHSYNHRRRGPDASDPPEQAPEINVGTGSLDERRWGHVVDAFVGSLRAQDFRGRQLDVQQNLRFRGGYFPRWVHSRFGHRGCSLAIEVKKIFMDEWSGRLDEGASLELGRALQATVPAVLAALFAVRRGPIVSQRVRP